MSLPTPDPELMNCDQAAYQDSFPTVVIYTGGFLEIMRWSGP